MKKLHHFTLTLGLLLAGALAQSSSLKAADDIAPNTLTPDEKAAGWELLFNGKTAEGWRNFHKDSFPKKGWVIENGTLKHVAGGGGGDIITDQQFTDFDLRWEWSIPPKANNGVKYFITESRGSAIGHEYQMIDDSTMRSPKYETASFYDVLPPEKHKPLKPFGQWNSSRILVRGNHVEHWLNGEKVLEYELGSERVMNGVAHSKFKNVPGFGTKIRGHILLTDHHDEASFRNIKILDLTKHHQS